MKQTWITIFPDTFIWIRGTIGLIYNSKKQNEFRFTLNNRIEQICKELFLPENLYSTIVTEEDLDDNEVGWWIHCITNKIEGGYLTSFDEQRPVSFKPILKINNNIEYYIWNHQRGTGGETLHNIHELIFYINKSEFGNNFYFRQTKFPLKNCLELDIESILFFIQSCLNPYLMNIELVGNIFTYSNYTKLINEITNLGIGCSINITLLDFLAQIENLNSIQISDQVKLNILIEKSLFSDSFVQLSKIEEIQSVVAHVLSTEEYYFFLDIFNKFPTNYNTQLIPIFNGDNLHFFEDNVFMGQEDIDNVNITKREIFSNQSINNNDFGKLTVLQDGSVYANVNMEKLGTVKDSPYSIVYKELTEGKSWRRIRDNKPCCECIYQWLCPSPSNYELVIGQPNLCHVKL